MIFLRKKIHLASASFVLSSFQLEVIYDKKPNSAFAILVLIKINYMISNNKTDNKRQQTITVDYKRLFNGFVLTVVFSLRGENTTKMEQVMQTPVPEFIETNLLRTKHRFKILTNPNKEFRSSRRIVIREAYRLLLSELNGRNHIKNDFLNEDIYIIWKESFQKASNNATRCWQTTYAVLKLPEIIKQAKPFDENYRFTDIKEGCQSKNQYIELIKLRHTFNNKKLKYMNFTIELVIGKKRDGKQVQYSLEHIKKSV